MAGPGIFNRTRIPLDADEAIPEATESTWSHSNVQEVPPEASTPAVQELHAAATPQGKAKARKVGKPVEELGPPKPERRICTVALRASGAGQESCNQDYRYCGLHQGKPMFKAENGAVIYFNKFWKMNKIYKTTGWIYCMKDSAGPWPAEGRWSSEGTSDPNGAGRPPSLVLIDEPLPRQVAEESGAYVLEDGQKVLKREENKSWRWNEVLVRSKEDILRSLLEPREERPSGLVSGFLEPKPSPSPPSSPKTAAPPPSSTADREGPRSRPKAKAKEPRIVESASPPEPRPVQPEARPPPAPAAPRSNRGPPVMPERATHGASARRFRPSSSTRESLAMAVAERKAAMAKHKEQVAARWAPEEVTDSQEGAAPDTETEMMVGGNLFRVRRLEEGDGTGPAPPSLQSMLAFIDAEESTGGGYPMETSNVVEEIVEKPKVKVECPPGPAACWSLDEVSQYLDFLGLRHIEEKFKENAVDGAMLVDLSEEDLCKELGLLKLQAKKLVTRLPRDA